jgi:hypothetical protein
MCGHQQHSFHYTGLPERRYIQKEIENENSNMSGLHPVYWQLY